MKVFFVAGMALFVFATSLLVGLTSADARGGGACSDPILPNIPDANFFATRWSRNTLKPQQARLSSGPSPTAWCLDQVQESDYLEINLEPRMYRITGIITRGRKSTGSYRGEFVRSFEVKYRHTVKKAGNWITWKNERNTTLFAGNTDTSNTRENRFLPQLLGVGSVRIYPKPGRSPVCLQLELLGCPWTDMITSYEAPLPANLMSAGWSRGLGDNTYDGEYRNKKIVNGIGQLCDHVIGRERLDQIESATSMTSLGYDYVGWYYVSQQPRDLTFRFSDLRSFKQVEIFYNKLPRYEVFSNAEVFIYATGRQLKQDKPIFNRKYRRPTAADSSGKWNIEFQEHMGRFLKLSFRLQPRQCLVLSEISFGNDALALPETPPPTTPGESPGVRKADDDVEVDDVSEGGGGATVGLVVSAVVISLLLLAAAVVFYVVRSRARSPLMRNKRDTSYSHVTPLGVADSRCDDCAGGTMTSHQLRMTSSCEVTCDDYSRAFDDSSRRRDDDDVTEHPIYHEIDTTENVYLLPVDSLTTRESATTKPTAQNTPPSAAPAQVSTVKQNRPPPVFPTIPPPPLPDHPPPDIREIMESRRRSQMVDRSRRASTSEAGEGWEFRRISPDKKRDSQLIQSQEKREEDHQIVSVKERKSQLILSSKERDLERENEKEEEREKCKREQDMDEDDADDTSSCLRHHKDLGGTLDRSLDEGARLNVKIDESTLEETSGSALYAIPWDLREDPTLFEQIASSSVDNLLVEGRPGAGWYDSRIRGLEFPRNLIEMVEVVGEGQFGSVHLCRAHHSLRGLNQVTEANLADAEDDSSGILVAAKVIHQGAPQESKEAFLKEVRVMSRLSHPNVVALLAVVTKDDEGPLMMITQYQQHGDLNQYLRKFDSDASYHHGNSKPAPSNNWISNERLMRFATQLACGMEYLESINCVHRDLAARNCLVGSGEALRVSDFGMSRHMYARDYYRVSSARALLPIRWSSWECVLFGKFSTASDVWSFATTLWEVFSLCKHQPYASLSDQQVVDNLKEMYQQQRRPKILPRPRRCPARIFNMMRRCWEPDIASRPPFADLHSFLRTAQTAHVTRKKPNKPPIPAPRGSTTGAALKRKSHVGASPPPPQA